MTAAAHVPPTHQAFGQLPLYFIENRGQMDARVAYYVQGRDTSVYFTTGGLTLAQTSRNERWAVKLDFIGASSVAPAGEVRTAAAVSYFKGGPQDWKTELQTYGSIAYRNLWPGVDLIYSGTVNRLKYEYVLQPGADVAQIRMRYRGASELRINQEGGLEVRTPAGGFADDRPYVYQEIDGRRVEIDSAYVLHGNGEYGFRVGDYDRTRPLILDPAVLVYCGFIGGFGDESTSAFEPARSAIAVDAAGNVYVTGGTDSTETDFPAIVGPDPTANGNIDVFIAKVNASGTGLEYAGFLGGSGMEWGYDIAVDVDGNAYITGFVNSNDGETYPDFPAIVGPDLTFNGLGDAFVAKVDATGTALVYSGFIGGSGNDEGRGIAVDAAGNAYVVGETGSHQTFAGFPVLGGPDLTFNGSTDTFVAKVNATGSTLVYSGYIGGEGTDIGRGIAVDGAGNAYVAGGSNSTGGIANWFAFVTKVDAAGTLAYHFQIQGANHDEANAIAVDADGNAYITGFTRSDQTSFPVTVGPDLTFNSGPGNADAFVAKINATGNALVYAGYVGGVNYDEGHGIAVDAAGNAYIAGRTHSTEATFPVSSGPDLTFNNPGAANDYADGFVVRVDASGAAMVYAGYIGGSFNDQATGIAVDAAGAAYVVGITNSTEADFPVTVGPDLTFNGYYDLFVAKISDGGPADVLNGNFTVVGTTQTIITLPPGITRVAGDIDVTDNDAAEVIDLSNVQTIDGSVTIIDNGDAAVELGPVETIGGDLTVESTGTGTFDVSALPDCGPVILGDATYTLAGYGTAALSASMGTTTTTVVNDDGSGVTIELHPTLVAGSCFTITHLLPAALPPEPATTIDGEDVVVDPVAAYQFTFDVPTLGVDATLTFEIDLAGLDIATRDALLEAVTSGAATLATRGDAADATYQTFPLCAGAEVPTAGGCVVLELLDANGVPTTGTPASVRFSNVVGHFSTWAVVMVAPPVHFNGLLQPYPAPPHAATPTFRRGSVVPLKFNWVNAAGTVLDSASARPAISVYSGSCSDQLPAGEPVAADDAGQSDGWRYDDATRTWIFGWSTRTVATGCYWLQVTSGTPAFPGPASMFPIALRDK